MQTNKCIQHSLKQDTPKCTPIKGQESKLHDPAPADPAQSDWSESQPQANLTVCTNMAAPDCSAEEMSPFLNSLHHATRSRDVVAAAQTFIPCLLQGISDRLSSTSPWAGFTLLASCWTFHTWQLGTQMRMLERQLLPQLCHQLASCSVSSFPTLW